MFIKNSLIILSFLTSTLSFAAEEIDLDGSSTVFPVAEAVAEEFQNKNRKLRVKVGLSGTGGGFKKFCAGETDISNASRAIKPKEVELCKKNGIEYMKLDVALDGISVVVSKNNPINQMTFEQLNKLWDAGSKIKKWNELDKKWPNEEIKLYGPGSDSGTFDFFTEEVNGKAKKSRQDYNASEDDNFIVTGVSQSPQALGYFGYAYFVANKNKLKALKIRHKGEEFVEPNMKTIESQEYPLSRPLFIYIAKKSAKRAAVAKFVEFFLNQSATLAKEVGYIPLPAERYTNQLADFKKWSK